MSAFRAVHVAILDDLIAGAKLSKFRRGWAPSKMGPFHPDRSVQHLIKRGLLLVSASGRIVGFAPALLQEPA